MKDRIMRKIGQELVLLVSMFMLLAIILLLLLRTGDVCAAVGLAGIIGMVAKKAADDHEQP